MLAGGTVAARAPMPRGVPSGQYSGILIGLTTIVTGRKPRAREAERIAYQSP